VSADSAVGEHINVLARQATIVELLPLRSEEVAELAAELGTGVDLAELQLGTSGRGPGGRRDLAHSGCSL
jgi:hypothetical protein